MKGRGLALRTVTSIRAFVLHVWHDLRESDSRVVVVRARVSVFCGEHGAVERSGVQSVPGAVWLPCLGCFCGGWLSRSVSARPAGGPTVLVS